MKKNLTQKLAANLNRSWTFAACASSLAAMIGCTSIGEQYVPPSSSQPSATLVPKEGNVFINTHDEKGCYQGRTEIQGEKEFKLRPGRETIFVYEMQGAPTFFASAAADSVCRAVVSFVPQEGAYYTITSTGAETTLRADGKQRWRYCGAAVSRRNADGTFEPVLVKKLMLQQRSINCIQTVER
jgi:hypothetical protein